MSLGKAVVKMCVMDEEMATYATAEADNALSCMFHEKVSTRHLILTIILCRKLPNI